MITKLNLSHFAFAFVGMVAIAMFSPDVMAAKVKICHKASSGKQKTIKVSDKALKAHEGHGDFKGRCDEVLNSERLMFRCDADALAGTILVTAASGSPGVSTDVAPANLISEECATAQVEVEAVGCKEIGVNGTPDAQVYSYACPDESAAIEPEPPA